MRKFYYKLKFMLFKLKFKIQKKFYTVSPRGEYMIKYLIDRYINCTTLEDNEIYESSLRPYVEKHVNKISDELFKNVPEVLIDDLKQYHCIFAYLCSLLLFSKDKQEWLDYINNEKIRALVVETIGD